MAHEVETMAYARVEGVTRSQETGGVPWHGLGVPVSGALTTEEMCERAGLAWTTRKVALRTVEDDDVSGRWAVVRDGDIPEGASRVLGTVGDEYECVWNISIFRFLESLVRDGLLDWETAMALREGRIVVVTARMGDDWRIGDDIHRSYLAANAGHDGGLSIGATATDTRIVCANTNRMAFGSKNQNALIRIRHTKNVKDAMAEAARVWQVTTEAQRRYQEWLTDLQAVEVERAATAAMLVSIFGDPNDAESPRAREAIRKETQTFQSRYLVPEVMRCGQNGYAVLNALTGYADYGLRYQGTESKRAESRFLSNVVGGRSVAFKADATAKVSELVGVRL